MAEITVTATDATIGGELVKAAEQGFLTGTIELVLIPQPSATSLAITAVLTDKKE